MKRIVVDELRKILSSRVLVCFLIILFVANVILCAVNAEDYQKTNSYDEKTQVFVDKVYDLYLQSPEFVLSEHERLMKITGARRFSEYKYCEKGYSDCDIFEKAYEVFGADELYHKKLAKLIAQTRMANRNIAYNEGGKESYLYRSNEAMLNAYTELNDIVTLTDRKVIGWNEYFSYSSEFFLVIGAVTLAAVYLAVADRKIGMSMIIGAAKNGRAPTATAKYLAVAIFAVLIVVLFALSSFFTILFTTGYSNGTVAVQSVKVLQLSVVRTSAVGMLFLSLFYKALAALGFALLLLAIVSFFKSYIFGVAVGFGLAGHCYFMTTLEAARFGQGIFLNFMSFYAPTGVLEHYRSVNIFEHAPDLRIVGLILLFVLLVGSFFLTLAAQSIRKPRTLTKIKFDITRIRLFKAKKKTRSYRSRRRTLSLFYYELFKQRYVFVLLVLLIVIKIIVSISYYQPVKNIYDTYKREYLSEIVGTYTEEKRAYLEKEKLRLAEYDARENEMQNAYSSGKIGIEEYSAFLGEQISAIYRTEVVEGLLDRADYLEKQHERTGVWGCFVYETGYNRYQNQPVDYMLLILLLIFACRLYLVEQEKRGAASPMILTVQTCPRGRLPLFARKLAVNLLFTTVAFAVFKGIDLFFLCKNFTLPDLSSPLISLQRYSSAPASFSLFGYLVFTIVFSFFGTLLLSIVFFLSSVYIKRILPTLLAAASLLFIPHFVYLIGQKAGNYIDLTQLQQTDRLFRYAHTDGGAMYYLFFATALAIVIALTLITIFKIQKGKKTIA